jgi:cytochrome c oxidase subunit 4
MADPHHAGDHADHGDVFKAYMVVAAALGVFTATSFIFNWMARSGAISTTMSFVLILSVAVVKAVLVAMYFMHLKWDWWMLYFLIVPVFIMGTMMMVVLLPDGVLGPHRDASEALQIAAEER